MDRALTTARDLIREVNDLAWTMPEEYPPLDLIENALAEVRDRRGLKVIEPKGGPLSQKLLDELRPIGASIDPKMQQNDTEAWCWALIKALGDLPPRLAIAGARAAIHRPMNHFSKVHGVIRECAKEAESRRDLAESRLRRLRAAAMQSSTPLLEKPKLRWDEESVARANATFKQAGITLRYKLDGEDVIEVDAQSIDAGEEQE